MHLSKFAKTAKEIILSSIAALLFFAVLATQEADAGETNKQEISKQQVSEFSQTIALVSQLEQSVIEAKEVLAIAQQNFEAGDLTVEEIFYVTLTYFEIENSLVEARKVFLVQLAQLQTNSHEPQQLLAAK